MPQVNGSTEGCDDARKAKGFDGDYSWLEDCIERLKGKEARREYYARLGKAGPGRNVLLGS
jgi:hypothetical protein